MNWRRGLLRLYLVGWLVWLGLCAYSTWTGSMPLVEEFKERRAAVAEHAKELRKWRQRFGQFDVGSEEWNAAVRRGAEQGRFAEQATLDSMAAMESEMDSVVDAQTKDDLDSKPGQVLGMWGWFAVRALIVPGLVLGALSWTASGFAKGR